ncbi:hypothetical protein BVI2075_350028 [Burkholderia vietnamiensis]|nr:hypothetical protein BVI2075_350028 [Burkholderia vietnamiensis]
MQQGLICGQQYYVDAAQQCFGNNQSHIENHAMTGRIWFDDHQRRH